VPVKELYFSSARFIFLLHAVDRHMQGNRQSMLSQFKQCGRVTVEPRDPVGTHSEFGSVADPGTYHRFDVPSCKDLEVEVGPVPRGPAENEEYEGSTCGGEGGLHDQTTISRKNAEPPPHE
jgi:hypothetical protein